MPAGTRRERGTMAGLLLVLLVAYNANGREIGSYDTRPTELAARELVLRGTLALNHVVGATPAYADRWGILLARDGRYRSVYSPVPAIEAAALTWPFWKLGVVDITAPLAPRLMAKATASLLVACAVVVSYRNARRWLAPSRALAVAAGLGLGTGLWSAASQTLWQSETSLLGLAVAILAFSEEATESWRPVLLAGAGLALAAVARPQLGPAMIVLLIGVWWRWGLTRCLVVCAVVAAAVIPWMAVNWLWFGHPLGALPLTQEMNASLHLTGRTFRWNPEAWAGLLVSPSRGLLVFSPIALVALLGTRAAIVRGDREPFVWCLLAMAVQFALFASYSVWWGGHTYGPRYLVDVLPLGVPPAALALSAPRLPRVRTIAAAMALAWSIAVAATGAFCYPHDAWNTDPTEIDRDHARLWDVDDNQIVRCWRTGLSPQNFDLFDRAAVRRAVVE